MNRVVRAIITCLLLVAVPVQGYAAGGMLFCGAGDVQSAALGDHHDAPASDAGHGTHDHDADSTGADDGGAPSLHDMVHGQCSACSSCCSATALPSAPIATATFTPRANPFPDFEHANPGQGPARLERPPRLHLA